MSSGIFCYDREFVKILTAIVCQEAFGNFLIIFFRNKIRSIVYSPQKVLTKELFFQYTFSLSRESEKVKRGEVAILSDC